MSEIRNNVKQLCPNRIFNCTKYATLIYQCCAVNLHNFFNSSKAFNRICPTVYPNSQVHFTVDMNIPYKHISLLPTVL